MHVYQTLPALLGLLVPGLAAQRAALPSPLLPTGSPSAQAGASSLELRFDPVTGRALLAEEDVTLVGFPSPAGPIDLELGRIPIDVLRTRVYVDGTPSANRLDLGDLSLWKGRIAGSPASDVLLGFSSRGCYGWILDGEARTHLAPDPGASGDWGRARLFGDEAIGLAGPPKSFACALDEVRDRTGGSLPAGPADGGEDVAGIGSGTLACPIAVETDYQLFQVFGDLGAEQNYVSMLMAAVSDRFLEQADVRLFYPYMAFYTTADDPWTSQDSGGGCGDVLTEFRDAWAGDIPEGAALGHFLSGASLGCGVAWLDVLCNDQFGFSLSCCINGGVTFPVTQGNNTWDFFVVAHELGHNFGSPHTHDFCPPLDQCAANCTGTTACTNQGTNMSYCHGCPGGMNNITTYFHPTVVDLMRTRAEASCLESACTARNYCITSANSFSATGATIDWGGSTSVSANDLVLWASLAAPGENGIFFYGPGPRQTPLGNGWLCVDPGGTGFQRLLPPRRVNAWGEAQWELDVTDPPSPGGQIAAGSTWHFQFWFRDRMGGGSGFDLSDGLEVVFCP